MVEGTALEMQQAKQLVREFESLHLRHVEVCWLLLLGNWNWCLYLFSGVIMCVSLSIIEIVEIKVSMFPCDSWL